MSRELKKYPWGIYAYHRWQVAVILVGTFVCTWGAMRVWYWIF